MEPGPVAGGSLFEAIVFVGVAVDSDRQGSITGILGQTVDSGSAEFFAIVYPEVAWMVAKLGTVLLGMQPHQGGWAIKMELQAEAISDASAQAVELVQAARLELGRPEWGITQVQVLGPETGGRGRPYEERFYSQPL